MKFWKINDTYCKTANRLIIFFIFIQLISKIPRFVLMGFTILLSFNISGHKKKFQITLTGIFEFWVQIFALKNYYIVFSKSFLIFYMEEAPTYLLYKTSLKSIHNLSASQSNNKYKKTYSPIEPYLALPFLILKYFPKSKWRLRKKFIFL